MTTRASYYLRFLLLTTCVAHVSSSSQEGTPFQPIIDRLPTVSLRGQEYRLGVEPVLSPRSLSRRYLPFFREVNANVGGFSVRLASALTPDVFEKKLRNGLFRFSNRGATSGSRDGAIAVRRIRSSRRERIGSTA